MTMEKQTLENQDHQQDKSTIKSIVRTSWTHQVSKEKPVQNLVVGEVLATEDNQRLV